MRHQVPIKIGKYNYVKNIEKCLSTYIKMYVCLPIETQNLTMIAPSYKALKFCRFLSLFESNFLTEFQLFQFLSYNLHVSITTTTLLRFNAKTTPPIIMKHFTHILRCIRKDILYYFLLKNIFLYQKNYVGHFFQVLAVKVRCQL